MILAAHTAGLRVAAGDLSWEALQAARANAERHGVSGRVDFFQGHLLGGLGGEFDLICANLPYIPRRTLRSLQVFGREPALALDGGPDGLALIRALLEDAPRMLAPQGILLLEIEASQGAAALSLARAALPGGRAQVVPDLAGRDRLLVVEEV